MVKKGVVLIDAGFELDLGVVENEERSRLIIRAGSFI